MIFAANLPKIAQFLTKTIIMHRRKGKGLLKLSTSTKEISLPKSWLV